MDILDSNKVKETGPPADMLTALDLTCELVSLLAFQLHVFVFETSLLVTNNSLRYVR